MTGKRRSDTAIEEDHPQTIKLEDNARGGSEAARHQPEPPKYEPTSDEASPIPADAPRLYASMPEARERSERRPAAA